MAKDSQKQAEGELARIVKPSARPGPVLPPGTKMVDSPDWDPAAPSLKLASPREKKTTPSATAPANSATHVRPQTGMLVLILVGAGILAGVGFALRLLLATPDKEAAPALVGAETEASTTPPVNAEPELPPLSKQDLQALYETHVATTAAALGVEPLTIAQLREPNVFYGPIDHGSPRIIAPSQSRREGPLTLRVRVDTLTLERGGIRSKGKHTTLVVKNTGEVPLAYRLLMRKAKGGECLSPVPFNYDAMVIDAGRTFEISVCGGRQSVEIIDLRMLEITSLGAAWVRQLPPQAVGISGVAAQAHDPGPGVIVCSEDAGELAVGIREGELAWEDVVDFYSRHDCAHYPWWSGYGRAEQALDSLPVLPP